jgi:NADP-dependent 3-hydroxy acid dehydrogenase YdfG
MPTRLHAPRGSGGRNLTGFLRITQLAIAQMEKRHSRHVVQITTSLIEHSDRRDVAGASRLFCRELGPGIQN